MKDKNRPSPFLYILLGAAAMLLITGYASFSGLISFDPQVDTSADVVIDSVPTVVSQIVKTAVSSDADTSIAAADSKQTIVTGAGDLSITQAEGGGCVANCVEVEAQIPPTAAPTSTLAPTNIPPTNTPLPTATVVHSNVFGQTLRQDYGLLNKLKGVKSSYRVEFNGATFLSGETDEDGYFNFSAPQYSTMYFCHEGGYGLQVPLDASVGNPSSPATFPLFPDNPVSCVP